MRPFDAAWSVLKAEKALVGFRDFPIGEGSFREVYPNRGNRGEVIKLPWGGGQQMKNIAAMNAMAQLGYPVAPEKPVLGYRQIKTRTGGLDTPRTMKLVGPLAAVTQPRANTTVADEGVRLENDGEASRPRQEALEQQYLDTVQHPLAQHGPIQDPLMQAIGVRDVRHANTGIYDDGMKAIDFEVEGLGAHHEPTYPEYIPVRTGYSPINSRGIIHNISDWLKVPDEQRRSFVNLFSDTSQFEPWDEARGPTGDLGAREQEYRRGLRNLQLINDMIDNPEQRRLFEFHDPDTDLSKVTDEWREVIENREWL